MPKKTQRRPAKSRARSSRPAPRTAPVAPPAEVEERESMGGTVVATVPRPAATTVQAARRPAVSRKMPQITVNYAYLRRDLTTLAVLAPSMVVLVILAFLFLH